MLPRRLSRPSLRRRVQVASAVRCLRVWATRQRWGDCRPRRAGRRQIRRPPLLLTRTGCRTPSSTVARRGRSPGDKHVERGTASGHGDDVKPVITSHGQQPTACGACGIQRSASSARRIAGGGIPCRQHDHIAGATAEKERRCLISARCRPRSTRPGCIPVPARDRCWRPRGPGMRWPCSWSYTRSVTPRCSRSCTARTVRRCVNRDGQRSRTRMWRGRRRRRRRLSKLLARLGRRRPP